ncbi:FCD domain-containing protein [Reyranella sp.]|uniref:FCD domain-containing protein n=1 Tax=Reyranella sp. TaxID=1929291 RepID=UPI002F95455D
MAKILKMPLGPAARMATTAPQDVLREDAATFDVLRQMREDILCCSLKPDQRLRFGELRQRYQTSVGTLREALSHLVSEGLARTEAGRGFSVAPVSLGDFLDLSELRVHLETRTLADAIHHGTDAWEAEIVSSYFLLSKLGKPTPDDPVNLKREWGRRHKRFHDALVATCTSPWSLHFRSELFDQARRYHWLTMIHARSRRTNEHLELRDAVLARDADLACRLIEKHIRTTVEQAVSEVPGLTMGGPSGQVVRSSRRNKG